jgi:hypothetical protein
MGYLPWELADKRDLPCGHRWEPRLNSTAIPYKLRQAPIISAFQYPDNAFLTFGSSILCGEDGRSLGHPCEYQEPVLLPLLPGKNIERGFGHQLGRADKRMDDPDWVGSVLRAPWVPFAAVLTISIEAGWVLQAG